MVTDYDAIASEYREFVEVSFIHRVSFPGVMALCGGGERVLDVACGEGVLTRTLADRYRTVVGVDISAAPRATWPRPILMTSMVSFDRCFGCSVPEVGLSSAHSIHALSRHIPRSSSATGGCGRW